MTAYKQPAINIDHANNRESELPEMDINVIDERNNLYTIQDQYLESWNLEMKEVYPYRVAKMAKSGQGFGTPQKPDTINHKVLFHHLRDNVITEEGTYDIDAITHSPIITQDESGEMTQNPFMGLFFFRTVLTSEFEYKDGEINYLPIKETDVLFYPCSKELQGIQVVDSANMLEILCGENADIDPDMKEELSTFIKSVYANAVEESTRIFSGKTLPEVVECIDKITYVRER